MSRDMIKGKKRKHDTMCTDVKVIHTRTFIKPKEKCKAELKYSEQDIAEIIKRTVDECNVKNREYMDAKFALLYVNNLNTDSIKTPHASYIS